MPLTLAHPAVILPLVRRLDRFVSPSALVIGSMSPDFAYILPLPLARLQTHDPVALLWFCLPMGAAGYALFHLLLKPIAARLLPAAIAARLPTSAFVGRLPETPRRVAVSSILIGAMSHLLLDSFTHRDGLVVQLLPILQTHILTIRGYRVHVFKVLQHTFSIIGLAMIWAWLRSWARRTPRLPDRPAPHVPPALRIACLIALIALPAASGAIVGARAPVTSNRNISMREITRSYLKGGGTAFCATWLTMGLLLRSRRPNDDPPR